MKCFSITANTISRKILGKYKNSFEMNLTESDNPLNNRKNKSPKKARCKTTVHWFPESIQFHRYMNDEVNTTWICYFQKNVAAKMMLYENTNAMVHSLNKDTYFCDIATDFLRGDILVPYMFRFCLAYILRTSIDLWKGGFGIKNGKKQTISRRNWQMQTRQTT